MNDRTTVMKYESVDGEVITLEVDSVDLWRVERDGVMSLGLVPFGSSILWVYGDKE